MGVHVRAIRSTRGQFQASTSDVRRDLPLGVARFLRVRVWARVVRLRDVLSLM